MRSEWFASWFDSPYYHILYQSHDDTEARLFIDRLLQALDLPGDARILDLACGKGRHARYLAEKGFDVTGLDISPSNIVFARQFEHERLTFSQHDMRRPFYINYFDAILNIFTSFGYFDSDEDHIKTLANVHRGLKSGGLFLLDFFNAQWVQQNMVKHEVKSLDGIEFHLHKTIRGNRIYKRVEFTIGDKKLMFREQVRLFSTSDFQTMFNESGLKIIEMFGDYDLSTFQPEHSRRLILIGQKPL
ncbi:MAG: methyltransferase domain-containing protein [Lewinellaceae bacterium]|nr:methyltransferase domain-containing protein [Lewinellaceae bacterium]